ncbi:monovalent cation/H+ antiporter complex subunit F [Corynebacterium otitidis]|uniref:Multicomponent Na+/H+ antiporter subunit F n=1 Tax=Corynebacterium otitidis ATCC 51513 TaxID=883169 RepID=I7JWE5_9CORY|nr:monovalent cation/H+ antiporter complex subunit F [Corynebacterium otitidis]EJZ81709.1 hypothetical protein HMPREF9719_01361 [Corynebacterium otitidis ATCC 51513]KKO83767.1 cation:proton antiporter [Corynebacterium otitidis]CCI83831.1 multicomponent Na+/H+ antiporter subunit F [Corynebacterium otitidis ATCC 51513]
MDDTLYNTLLFIPAVIFCLAFLLTSYRIAIGPNSMDRVMGLDGMIAMIQCMLSLYICWSLDTTVTAAMLVVALLGFISTVSVARFRKRDGA